MQRDDLIEKELLKNELKIEKLREEVSGFFNTSSGSLKELSDLHKQQSNELLSNIYKSSLSFKEMIEKIKAIKKDVGDLEKLAAKTKQIRQICDRLADKEGITMN